MSAPDPTADPVAPPPREVIAADVERALAEDVGGGDVTAALVPARRRAQATVVAREAAVLAGAPWFEEVFRQLDGEVSVRWQAADGASLAAGAAICRVAGPARAILTGERTALNFLALLSGTATATRAHVEALAGTRAALLDTRKTVPGLRAAQKYAVRCGGGVNHRRGLFDAFLIKENHILACGSITTAVELARLQRPGAPVEVEVEDLEQLEEALAAGADRLLLDNLDLKTLREAVRRTAGRARLEASGNLSPDDLAAVAATGVDAVSVGGLTKHVRAVDLTLRFELVRRRGSGPSTERS